MKIVKLEAENVKRLRAVHIAPDGSTVVIGGRNGQGKTSVLDSIEMALAGKRSVPEKPVREGEESARIVVDLGDLMVRRTFRADGRTSLQVESKDGARYRSPQAMLDRLVGKLSFDPLAFSRMNKRDRVEMLRSLVGVDFSDLERRRAVHYENRTAVNRDIRKLESRLESLPAHPDAPEKEESVSELATELERAQEAQRRRSSAEDALSRASSGVQQREREVDDLKRQLSEALQRLEQARNHKSACHGALEELPEPPDTSSIRERVRTIEERNEKARANAMRARLVEELAEHRAATERDTQAISDIDSEKQRLIAEARLPVEGLSFDDSGVSLDGVPFEQASSAEQLRVSVAMGLALNPELRVLLVRDGSLLDEDSLKLITVMAEENGAQVWLERVGDGDPTSVLIEDGQVRE